mmetsp:Transcript_19188/g.26929  ORF Transcript_19188/g.26929 Transcript_19188/m.26929 type:complete len:150 (-) Transcript_19188:202-651(-)|eukprot:CAMPEP_0175097378 /NCGR_PEP_ID=MMETSP0086_2-20121207/5254_1 /TAXON_ID=136419 /ORGANISM="Unknown Unknown, Strain D1" /LENGTH=149 /DNA_ID=CAMNT_0016370883 /DNA_START=39 /DNA_END=488 /DNA_ORIENTATION=+
MSGIVPSDEATAAYNKVKTGKQAWACFVVQDEKSVECSHSVDYADGQKNDFEKFESGIWAGLTEYVEENLADKAAYIIVDVKQHKDGRDQAKLTIISWCPENKIKVKAKMLHGSTLNAVKQCFEGLQGKPVQASSVSDLEFSDVCSEIF